MRQALILFTLLIGFQCAHAQWPALSFTDLSDNAVTLPAPKAAIIGLAFSKKAQDDLTSWIEPLWQQLLDPSGTGSWVYDGEAYLVIAFTGAKKAALKKVREQIREATDNDFFARVLLYEGSMTDFESLDIQDKNAFYVYTLSPFGDVLVREKGRYTQEKLDALCLPLEK